METMDFFHTCPQNPKFFMKDFMERMDFFHTSPQNPKIFMEDFMDNSQKYKIFIFFV